MPHDRLLNAILRPLVRMWLSTTEMSRPDLPRPPATARVSAGGADPAHVLLVGNGPSVGYGVLSHELALAGHLGRQLSALTGRATVVDVVADGTMTAGSATGSLESRQLATVDTVVLTIGVNETLSLAPVARWSAELDSLFLQLDARMPRGRRACILAIPSMRSIGHFPRVLVWVVDRHTARLNEALRAACARHARVVYVPFDPGAATDRHRYRGSETYRGWAALVVGTVHGQLPG